ncbi:hypothetical protein QTP88_024602 [Uroleucon formosanum]
MSIESAAKCEIRAVIRYLVAKEKSPHEIFNEEGRPSISTDDIVKKVENAVRDDRRLTLDELSAMFPQLSRSLLHETITETLEFHKLCARWVPKQLTEQHMLNRVQASREFLERYELDAKKIMASVFWDHKGIILIEYLPRGETINAARYCEILKKLRRAIQNKRRGLLTSGPTKIEYTYFLDTPRIIQLQARGFDLTILWIATEHFSSGY